MQDFDGSADIGLARSTSSFVIISDPDIENVQVELEELEDWENNNVDERVKREQDEEHYY